MRAVLAKPRGFCAGVERAIRVVELALEKYGAPVYVRNEIVHNSHVIRRLGALGAVFVRDLAQIPPGAVAILSAHGSAPEVFDQSGQQDLRLINATCPLVTKVHIEVRAYSKRGYRIILIGHAGHDEVVGTLGQAPEAITLVETVADAERLHLRADEKGVVLTQTTLSQDDTREIVDALLARFPHLELPPKEDICYATQNRQNAVKAMVADIDLLLVVGSDNSSNSIRLTEVARTRGVPAHLIDGPEHIETGWFDGVTRVGVTSGASAPEEVVEAVLARLGELGVSATDEIDAPDEGVEFKLPPFVDITHRGQPVG